MMKSSLGDALFIRNLLAISITTLVISPAVQSAEILSITREDYEDRMNAIWQGQMIQGGETSIEWETTAVDLSTHADREVTLRLYQRVLLPGQRVCPGSAYWKSMVIRSN